MDAYVSGQAALAIILEDSKAFCLHLDEDWPPTEIAACKSSRLLKNCTDIIFLYETNREQIIQELEIAWAKDRALHLMLIMGDKNEDRPTREEAAECLDELLQLESVMAFVLKRLYSSPIPDEADLSWCAHFTASKKLNILNNLVNKLIENQYEIVARCKAWDELPIHLFDNLEYKHKFKHQLIEAGAFLSFVRDRDRSDEALLKLHVDPQIRGLKNARIILQNWAKPFRESITGRTFEGWLSGDDNEVDHRLNAATQPRNAYINGIQAFENAKKQKNAIKQLINKGDNARVLEFTRQLIRSQRMNSDPDHIAKSLCDLAQHAKSVANYQLQLTLSEWAINELPSDSWSHAQVADAYRLLGDYDKAIEHYQKSGALGDERIALCGRAEVLKDTGDLIGCLNVYRECSRRYPTDVIALNGSAAALAHFGRLDEASQKYDAILSSYPTHKATVCGKAQVLRDMGNYEHARDMVQNLLDNYGFDPIAANIKAAIHRDTGRLDEAMTLYTQLVNANRFDIFARTGLANTFKDLQKYEISKKMFIEIAEDFKFDSSGNLGLAAVHKVQGNLNSALTTYVQIEQAFPRLQIAKNGMAAVLGTLGQYREALALLPNNSPSTLSEWMAFHIRGMLYMKQGKINDAIELLETGFKNSPWVQVRQYYRTALSVALIKRKKAAEAERLLEDQVIPTLRPARELLRMHAATMIVQSSDNSSIKHIISNKNFADPNFELKENIIKLSNNMTTKNRQSLENDIFRQECILIMLAA